MDVHFPGGGGAAVIQGSTDVDTKFLALSVSDAAEDMIAVIRAGTVGLGSSLPYETQSADDFSVM